MRELKVSLERARFDSVKRRAANVNQIANITINNTVSFNVTTDLNQNGTIDVEETREIDFAGNGVNFVGNNLNYPIIIRFDHHGFVTATNGIGTEITPNFTICKNCTVSTINAGNSHSISVSPTGTVLMTAGGENFQPFENPTVSTVAVGSQINQLVSVNP